MPIRLYVIFICFVIGLVATSGVVAETEAEENAGQSQADPNAVPGITDNEIILGAVLPLEGRAAKIGIGMQVGLNKALAGQVVGGRKIRIIYADDLYEPVLTPLKVQLLLKKGIFAMIGNVGTSTAVAALPILKTANIPAIGFLTGSSLLRTAQGLVLNYRASYAQETATILAAAFAAGIKPEQVCAYVQNDAYGKDGLMGIQEALQRVNTPPVILDGLRTLLANSASSANGEIVQRTGLQGAVNNNGPVGLYTRGRLEIMPGYEALKNWERNTGYRCALVVAVGVYDNLAYLIHTARSLGENWIFAVVSFAGAEELHNALRELEDEGIATSNGYAHNVLMTQVVPTLESPLPIVTEALQALGKDFGFVSLEGYIVGKTMLNLLQATKPPLTQIALINQAKQSSFDVGGLTIDFTHNGYQGSNLVTITKLTAAGYSLLLPTDWNDMLAWQPAEVVQEQVAEPQPVLPTATKETKKTARQDKTKNSASTNNSATKDKRKGNKAKKSASTAKPETAQGTALPTDKAKNRNTDKK